MNQINCNLIESYTYLKNIESGQIDFNDIVFYTKEKFESVLLANSKIFKIFNLLDKLFIYDNIDIYKEIVEISNTLSEEELLDILYGMVENGISYAPLFAKEFALDISNINVNDYLAGIEVGGENLIFSNNYTKFIDSCSNQKKLLEQMLNEGFIEHYEIYHRFSNQIVNKLDTKKMNRFLYKFKKRFNSYSLNRKIDILYIYNWDFIIFNLFEDSNNGYNKLKKIFTFTKTEKEELKKLKSDELYIEFIDNIKREKEDLVQDNYLIIKEIPHIDNNILESELIKIAVSKNSGNSFEVSFIDILGRKNTYRLGNNNLCGIDAFNELHYDTIDFIKAIKEKNIEYLNDLEKNDLDFTILISKSNGITDDTDNYHANNSDYMAQNRKSA